MWTAPAPAWNQTVPGFDEKNIKTAVIRVLNGSTNVHVKWDYDLLDRQSLWSASFSMDTKEIGVAYYRKSSIVKYDFRSRFSISSTNEFSSLTINTVTERENAMFQCRLCLNDGMCWAYNIRVEVTGTTPMVFYISCSLIVRNVSSLSLLANNVTGVTLIEMPYGRSDLQ